MKLVQVLKNLGLKWEPNTIGILFDCGWWNVNVVFKNDDGSRKPVFGFLKFDDVAEAVDAREQLRTGA
jgi:hypothetical protein